ncbi:hypothetical protein KY326_02380 [Candidatus Woesearchaeota archaeon]|nr:hypothetical protein [Candidatus Woesearchaeota archaeon]
MDDKVEVLGLDHTWGPNLGSVKGSLEDAMQLRRYGDHRFYPVELRGDPPNPRFAKIANSGLLFLGHDREYDVITGVFQGSECKVFDIKMEHDGKDYYFRSKLPYHHLLNFPNTRQDILFRRAAVEELLENEELYRFVEQLLSDSELYPNSHERFRRDEIEILCDLTPEKFSGFFHKVLEMKEFGLQSPALKRLYSWAEEMEEDIYFQELLRKKRRITDARVIALFSERFADIRYAMLKPGVNPEDVFEFLSPDMSRYFVEKTDRRGRRKQEERKVVKFKDGWDDEVLVGKALGHARQRMDIVNEISARILAIPVFLAHLQIKHLFQGAFLYKELQRFGYPAAFPEIAKDRGVLEVEDIYPIRMVFERIGRDRAILKSYKELTKRRKRRDFRESLARNTFQFSKEHRVIQAEGPNKRGKSEAWRTIHLFIALANAGYPVPAASARYCPVPNSHFISCKGSRGHGGSELERSLRGVEKELEEVHPGDNVILDELGDSTNAHTAREAARRLLPVLIKNGCRVFVTSHHDALTNYISSELGGLSFMPMPGEKEKDRFRLVPRAGEVDFLAEETLDDLKFTPKKLNKGMPKDKRSCAKRREPGKKRGPGHYEYHDEEDIPF